MHLYRIDHSHSYTHAWSVTIQRRGRVYHRHFTDSVYGGKSKTLNAAKVYRDTLVNCLRPLTRLERCRIKKKNNRSGISGVIKIDTWQHNRGRRYHRRYWLAQWPIGNGKAQMKKFSIMRYGERGAFQRALRARQEALKRLAKRASLSSLCGGVIYGPCHDILHACLQRNTPRLVSLPSAKVRAPASPPNNLPIPVGYHGFQPFPRPERTPNRAVQSHPQSIESGQPVILNLSTSALVVAGVLPSLRLFTRTAVLLASLWGTSEHHAPRVCTSHPFAARISLR